MRVRRHIPLRNIFPRATYFAQTLQIIHTYRVFHSGEFFFQIMKKWRPFPYKLQRSLHYPDQGVAVDKKTFY
jgi:hypothetical protein